MSKELCKLKKSLFKSDMAEYCRLVNRPKAICRSCGRVANSKKSLCRPKKIVS